MLVRPSPGVLRASSVLKPQPESETVKTTSSESQVIETRYCSEPLCLTAFCNASWSTRNRQSEVSSGSERGTFSEQKSICEPCRSESSRQKAPAAADNPRYSSLEECSRWERA